MNPVQRDVVETGIYLFFLRIFAFCSLPEIPTRRSTRRPSDPNGGVHGVGTPDT